MSSTALIAALDQMVIAARATLATVGDADSLQAVRVRYLGRKGELTAVLKQLGALDATNRRAVGEKANAIKAEIEAECVRLQATLADQADAQELSGHLDITLPGRTATGDGAAHPIHLAMQEICRIFEDLGFSTFEGPEIETEYYNFEALNVPPDHPARDMQDTLYLQIGTPPLLLRTHTSSVQIRVMQGHRPPIRMIAPGVVYRRDETDMTHSPVFHQVEGLYVDTHVTFSHLKGVLMLFLERLFGPGLVARFRPSFFPFTEPSAEVDLGYVRDGARPRLARQGEHVSGWLEILGCGMVDPAVFAAVDYDPEAVTGFAFGLGVERIAMLKYGIDDIRLFYENDLRFLRQFARHDERRG